MHSKVVRSTLSVWQQLRHHGWRHWVTVALLTTIGTWAGHYIGEHNLFVELRYSLYNSTMRLSRVRGPLYPQRTAIVFVGDEEYWSEELAGRVPFSREYLARLIEKIEQADPAAIAIDFDLRSPYSSGNPREFKLYALETARLADSIRRASERVPIILPATIEFDSNGDYVRQASVLDGAFSEKQRISYGYVELPFDLRRVPISIELSKGTLDSFSGAIVRAIDEQAYKRVEEAGMEALPFASYISDGEFRDSKNVVSATKVLNSTPEELRSLLAHRAVILGADWSSFAYHSGPRVDTHAAATGSTPGAVLHANYVEAVLGARTFRPISERAAQILELLLVVLTAIVAALELRPWIKITSISAIFIATFLFSYVLMQSLGLFLDFFVPVLVLGGHMAVDKVLEWRRKSIKAMGAAH